jgi:hypothetical protein
VRKKEYVAASRTVVKSLYFLHQVDKVSDYKIFNSAIGEQMWLGSARKSKLVKGQYSKNYCMEEFHFHARLAVGKQPLKGLLDSRSKVDVYIEAMELLIAQSSALPSQNGEVATDQALLPFLKPTLQPRRVIEQQSILKDIYATFITCGTEWTFQELGRFKKNPRYLELVSKLVEWSVEKDHLDISIRLCTELEEWLDKRLQTFLKFDDVIYEPDGQKDVIPKRKKRLMFANDKQQLRDDIKGVSQYLD